MAKEVSDKTTTILDETAVNDIAPESEEVKETPSVDLKSETSDVSEHDVDAEQPKDVEDDLNEDVGSKLSSDDNKSIKITSDVKDNEDDKPEKENKTEVNVEANEPVNPEKTELSDTFMLTPATPLFRGPSEASRIKGGAGVAKIIDRVGRFAKISYVRRGIGVQIGYVIIDE